MIKFIIHHPNNLKRYYSEDAILNEKSCQKKLIKFTSLLSMLPFTLDLNDCLPSCVEQANNSGSDKMKSNNIIVTPVSSTPIGDVKMDTRDNAGYNKLSAVKTK